MHLIFGSDRYQRSATGFGVPSLLVHISGAVIEEVGAAVIDDSGSAGRERARRREARARPQLVRAHHQRHGQAVTVVRAAAQ